LDETRKAIVRAIRMQAAKGRTHGQLALELDVSRRTVSYIIRGERGIGGETLLAIQRMSPPWLRDILKGNSGSPRGGNGKGDKEDPK
jgi:hypothetical protein